MSRDELIAERQRLVGCLQRSNGDLFAGMLLTGKIKAVERALAKNTDSPHTGEVCRCSEEARTNRIAARMGASFKEAGDD